HASRTVGPPRPNGSRYPTPAELLSMMDEAHIDRAVVMAAVSPECGSSRVSPEDVLEICAAHPNRLIPFANVDPRMLENSPESDFTGLLQHYREAGCRGIGEYTPNLPFDDPLNMNVFKQVEEAGLPLTFHVAPRIGGFYGCVDELGLPRLERVLQACPNLVLLGHSQPFWAEIGDDVTEDNRNSYPEGPVKPGRLVQLMRDYANLCGDLSAESGYNAISRDPEFGCRFLEEFQDRLYFGTDIANVSQDLPIVSHFRDLQRGGHISESALEKITWRNAVALLGLEPAPCPSDGATP
ncbi:MAG: amidohydrolase family protein, partial [Candidatus Brocadiae bacterium]|nr:amidohydrolase family protein [Candidatus Brocadiia bacterium]